MLVYMDSIMVGKKKNNIGRRGAQKGDIRNPEGRNQYDGILAQKPVCTRLYIEDDEILNKLSEGQSRGFVGEFIREAVRRALTDIS
jgi:hypothetical protein